MSNNLYKLIESGALAGTILAIAIGVGVLALAIALAISMLR